MLSPIFALALVSLGAAPASPPAERLVTVRVLERERLPAATVSADQLFCDGAAVSPPRSANASGGALRLGEQPCATARAVGHVQLQAGERTFRYSGELTLSAAKGALVLFNRVELEAYVARVVTAELASGPAAALEAQAVVSRTFAVTASGRHADHTLCDLTHCQRYPGDQEPNRDALAAAAATRGLVLWRGGVTLEPTYFHAACGGHTSDEAEVFPGQRAAGGTGVPDLLRGRPACEQAPDFEWRWSVPRVELARALGRPEAGQAFEPLHRDAAGRVVQLRSFGERLSGVDFASLVGRAFGWQALRSLKVSATEAEGDVLFLGKGLGHGVGLCQAGAVARAQAGAPRDALLAHYFPQSLLRPLVAR